MQLNLEETSVFGTPVKKDDQPQGQEEQSTESAGKDDKKNKAQPQKLPKSPKFNHESSTTAADDVLRKFFNRR